MTDILTTNNFNIASRNTNSIPELKMQNPNFNSLVNFYTVDAQPSAQKLPDNPAYRVIPNNNLNNADNTIMLKELNTFIDSKSQKLLKKLLNNGKLLSNKSNDGTTTLENLYKLMKQPREEGFDSKILIEETLNILADPYTTTQDFGKTPKEVLPQIIQYENERVKQSQEDEKAHPMPPYERKPIDKIVTDKDIDFSKGHTCPAASIEFDIADKKPAEFARYVERLTSPEKSVKTVIKYSNIADDLPAAISILQDWKVDYKKLNSEDFEVTLRPDDNAYPRAEIQERFRAKNSRSTVDSILQSTFMQVGSAKTYNSLTDLRSEDTGGGRGLNQQEIALVESVVDYEGGKDSVTYMELDNDLTKLKKYNFSNHETEKMLIDTLSKNKNIIVGFLTDLDTKGNLITPNGHEVLLTGITKDKKGELYFKYNDTDDGDIYAPSFIKVKELVRTLHHANLPKDIVKKYVKQEKDPRMQLVSDLWDLKKQNETAQNLTQAA